MSVASSAAPAATLHTTAAPGAAPAARPRGASAGAAPAAAHAASGGKNGAADAFAALLELAGADDSAGTGVTMGGPTDAAKAAAPLDAAQKPEETDAAAWPAAGDALLLLAPTAQILLPTVPAATVVGRGARPGAGDAGAAAAASVPTAPAGKGMPALAPLRDAPPTAAGPGLEASPAAAPATGDALSLLAPAAQAPLPPYAAAAAAARGPRPAAGDAGDAGGTAPAGAPGDPTSLADAKPAAPAGKDAPTLAAADGGPVAVADAASPARSPNGFAALLAQAKPDNAAPLRDASPTAAQRGLEAPPALLLQPPVAPAPAGPAAVHQAALPSRPLDAAFAGDLAAEVRVMVDAGIQRAELHLNPADLGPIHIELSLNAQTADISFAAAHSTTRDGLAQALPALREMLAGQGLSLGQAGVSSGQQGQTFADAQHQARAVPPGTPRSGGGAEPAGSGWAPGTATLLRTGRGMLDLYA